MKDYKISKAQLEVWEWKESLYQEVKDMSIKDALRYIIEKGARVSKKIKKIASPPTGGSQ